MQNLIPFQSQILSLSLKADLQRLESKIILVFELSDAYKLVNAPQAFEINGDQVNREDGLWNETCFEMFLRPVGQKKYYEFNFSLKPAWNEYVFTDYRHPQPPTLSHDFALSRMQWDGQKLQVELADLHPQSNYEISITAIIKEKSGTKHYLALAHKGEKPDFHLADSFILKR